MIKYHKDSSKALRIVGFEVEAKSIDWEGSPCSHDPAFSQAEAHYVPDSEIDFTYEVHFEESDTLWADRFEHYIKTGNDRVHHI